MTMKVWSIQSNDYGLTAEDIAMVQALYSRSPRSVQEHLEKVKNTGSGKFMDRYYVGYGHDSIGDCGPATVFVENVSLLAAKALQQSPLYNGQEASTRYLDFSQMGVETPFDLHPTVLNIQERQLELYQDVLAHVQDQLIVAATEDNPDPLTETHRKAIKARAFDVARGFLPAGVRTNLSIHMGLRALRDHLRVLSCAPLPEIRNVAGLVWDNCRETHPNSFDPVPVTQYPTWYGKLGDALYGQESPSGPLPALPRPAEFSMRFANPNILHTSAELDDRPRGRALLPAFARAASITMTYALDFGSYRDLQRHRRADHDLLAVRPLSPCHDWYMQHLSPALADRHHALAAEMRQWYEDWMQMGNGWSEQDTTLAMQYACVLGQQVYGAMQMGPGGSGVYCRTPIREDRPSHLAPLGPGAWDVCRESNRAEGAYGPQCRCRGGVAPGRTRYYGEVRCWKLLSRNASIRNPKG